MATHTGTMAENTPNPSFKFIVDYLERKPTAPFAEVRDAAGRKGYTIYPIVYGRAKAVLGLVPSKPRGTGAYAMATKAAKAKASGQPVPAAAAPRERAPAASTAPAKRGPGRPPKTAASSFSSTGGFTDIIEAVRGIERERDEMRSALAKIREVLASVE